MTWKTPAGTVSRLYLDILKQPHTLIAGATGSGKSVAINGILYALLYSAPCQVRLILIDPKRVELVKYKPLPHVTAYASEPPDITAAIEKAVETMESRYKAMQAAGETETKEAEIYLIIDEFADLMTTQKKTVLPSLCRLAQLGRAAHIHLIIATQRPTADIITGQIKVNIDSRLALRCPTAQDSRNIINTKGAETLPRYGYGYYLTPDTIKPQLVKIPYTPPESLIERVKWWTDQRKPRKWSIFRFFAP